MPINPELGRQSGRWLDVTENRRIGYRKRRAIGPPVSNPHVVGGTRLHPRPGAPYSIEILVDSASGYAARKIAKDHNGFPKVEMKIGEIYAVKIYNDTDYEMVALVSIDGLSRFAFSDKESDRTSGGDIVPARSTHTIKGYFRDVKTVEAFKVGSYSDSVGAKLLPAPDSGTVAVVFRAAWKVGETEPPGENNLATKLPPGTQVPSGGTDPTVPARRNIGNIRAVLRVRY